mgnify:CR=1 FL=1
MTLVDEPARISLKNVYSLRKEQIFSYEIFYYVNTLRISILKKKEREREFSIVTAFSFLIKMDSSSLPDLENTYFPVKKTSLFYELVKRMGSLRLSGTAEVVVVLEVEIEVE